MERLAPNKGYMLTSQRMLESPLLGVHIVLGLFKILTNLCKELRILHENLLEMNKSLSQMMHIRSMNLPSKAHKPSTNFKLWSWNPYCKIVTSEQACVRASPPTRRLHSSGSPPLWRVVHRGSICEDELYGW